MYNYMWGRVEAYTVYGRYGGFALYRRAEPNLSPAGEKYG
jgi:hypothetical protein